MIEKPKNGVRNPEKWLIKQRTPSQIFKPTFSLPVKKGTFIWSSVHGHPMSTFVLYV